MTFEEFIKTAQLPQAPRDMTQPGQRSWRWMEYCFNAGFSFGYAEHKAEHHADFETWDKATNMLVQDCNRLGAALERIAGHIPASRQNTPISYLQGIAKEALGI